jgi:hypothetical protein
MKPNWRSETEPGSKCGLGQSNNKLYSTGKYVEGNIRPRENSYTETQDDYIIT